MFKEIILKLTKQLYPKGRAFRIAKGSTIEKIHNALAVSENEAYEATLSILDSILPDNNNFTVTDAENWERRLGLISNSLVLLADRKAAILRKMNHPGTIPARQHFLYLQRELQAANFNVWVHENRFFNIFLQQYETKTVQEVAGIVASGTAVHTTLIQHGQLPHGGSFGDKIVNSVDPVVDAAFNVGSNLRSTFFLGGQVLGTFATIPASREVEFRQLVLKIKPAQTVAFTLLNTTGPDFNNDFNNDFSIT